MNDFMLEFTDEQIAAIESLAIKIGKTVEEVVAEIVAGVFGKKESDTVPD